MLSHKFWCYALQTLTFLAIGNDMSNTAEQIDSAPMPTSPEELMARLKDLGIDYAFHEHKAVFTVAEAQTVEHDIPGTHCRNLFLRDKKKNNFLVVLQNATEVDIKKLQPLIGADKLSFGSSERLWEYLGVRPGSVCPYAIINDKNMDVKIFLDKSMMDAERVNYHPLINTMTIGTTPAELIRFIESTGHTPHIIDFSAAAPDKE